MALLKFTYITKLLIREILLAVADDNIILRRKKLNKKSKSFIYRVNEIIRKISEY